MELYMGMPGTTTAYFLLLKSRARLFEGVGYVEALAERDAGNTFELVECPGGTGEMQVKLREGEIDICIALTDALIAGIANGQTAYKLVGRYIKSSLRWAVITGKDSPYQSVDDLKGRTFGISRLGSGSQVMASVLSMNEGWSGDQQPKFQVNGQFKPLRDSVNKGDTAAFLWEWFTTKPFVDSGEIRFIGSVLTPWPCWSIAAAASANPAAVETFLDSLQPFVTRFDSAEARKQDDVDFVVKYFGHQRADVEEWLKTVQWESTLRNVDEAVVRRTLEILTKAGVVKDSSADIRAFVNTDIARLV